ncbi:hypothetical protein [Planctomycetes bacterium K23_9]|uniref:Uncharacterized protein n=1 Tax=Stieleria marina TaxID=1930275 RepID=A0A517P1E6_9BACT|nr:hypothetical protein K239x_52140 [Planctomycetes bacterium K23_9]
MVNANARQITTNKRQIVVACAGALLAAGLTLAFTVVNQPGEAPDVPRSATPAQQDVAADSQEQSSKRAVRRAIFFDEKVEPRIVEADALNREAADRCIAKISAAMDHYRGGVEPFVDDLTSISTRFGIVKRMPSDWWRKENKIENFVEDKFQQHLFSQQTLMDDIAVILADFKSEIDTNQKRMLISVKTDLNAADLPEVQADEYQPFFESVSRQLQGYSAKQGTASVQNAVGVLIISEAGVFAGRSIVVGLLARFGSTAVVSSAAGATATAGTTAAGTGTGAFGGPVGAVVGFGVGLAVGMVIDWWMTEQFEAKMRSQMYGYLNTLENTILYGGATSADATAANEDGSSGLVGALPVVCDRLSVAYRERFYEQIVTGTSTP